MKSEAFCPAVQNNTFLVENLIFLLALFFIYIVSLFQISVVAAQSQNKCIIVSFSKPQKVQLSVS